MSKSKEYWERRFEQLEDAQSRKGAEYFAELEKQYNKAALAVQDDINKWYARFADNNEITMQEARKMLTASELEEFKWNVMEYIEKGRTLNYSNQWAKQLENASARFHISRLEALKIQMQNHVEVLYGNELDDLSKLMEKIYTDGYYHTAYEIQKGFNIGYHLMRLDENKIEKVLSKPWAADGSNFSSRIWKQKSQLVSELHNNLTQAIIRGQNPHVVTNAIAKRFNVSKGQAGRLVMTEAAFFSSASNRDCYKDLGVKQYEVLATLDKKTSDICRALDGMVFPMSEYAVGVTAPPFHTWCRTTTVPYFDDEFELDTQRAARDADGTTYYVPASMKYDDWYKAFVDNNKNDFKELRVIGGKFLNFSDRSTIKEAEKAMPQKVVEALKEVNVITDSPRGNGFDFGTNTIHLVKGARKRDVFHECAHAIENKLFDKNKVNELKRELTKGLGISNIKKIKATKSNGDVAEIYILKSNKFISPYQSRIYADSLEDCLDADGNIDIDKMEEVVSVAFEYYMSFNKTMKKHFPDMYDLVRGSVE